MRRSPRQWLVPALLVLVFAAPLAGSWYLFNFTQIGRGADHSHGQLIVPPRPLAAAALYDAMGVHMDASLRQRWTLLFLVPDDCDRSCLQMLAQMRQLSIALGKDAHRVQRALVVYGRFPPDWPAHVAHDFPGQLMVAGSALDGDEPGRNFRLGIADEPVGAGRLYIVDPMGNLMLAYPRGTDPAGIIRDLKRLLRYSGAG
jgi:cytochrome oxidase Cu insertion factor (SCO1/SenC/PrrC family)